MSGVCAILFLLAQPVAVEARRHGPALLQVAEQETDLKGQLRRAFEDLNARKQGLFHEDVTATVAPFFPLGQPFDATQRTVREQGLGSLEKFKGVPHDGTAMYLLRLRIASAADDNVYVVIDFDFDHDMRLKQVKAFMRAANM